MATLTDAKIRNALLDAHGIIAQTARALGVTRQTVYNRIEKSLALQAALDEARENLTDTAENQLARAIVAGNLTAIIFHLKNSPSGRKRGYGERTELTGANNGPLQAEIIITQVPARASD